MNTAGKKPDIDYSVGARAGTRFEAGTWRPWDDRRLGIHARPGIVSRGGGVVRRCDKYHLSHNVYYRKLCSK
jgi:hypothetical protein